MAETYTVSLNSIIEEFALEKIYVPENIDEIVISKKEVNRPGLQLAGFFDHFEPRRIQIIGKVEYHYLLNLELDFRQSAVDSFFNKNIACLIITSGLNIFPEIEAAARKYNTPLLRTNDITSNFMGGLISSLNVSLAERMTRHGVFVECYGEGILKIGRAHV